MSKDYYKILGVEKTATHDEIKKAFRKKAHEFHPDKSSGDEAKFKEINEAYQIVGNAEKRTQYDQFGDGAFSGQGFGGTGMNWQDFMRQAQQASSHSTGQGFGGGGVQFDFGDLGDMFGDIFGFGGGGRRSQGSRAHRGEDVEIQLTLDFKEAIFGVERTIRLERIAKCEHCHGNGAEPGTKISSCDRCKGSGVVTQTRSTVFGAFQSQAHCPECGGEGKSAEQPCKQCNGEGRKRGKEDVVITIPAGIDNGQRVRLHGKGNAGIAGGETGDLYIHLRVKDDVHYERDGYDIHSKKTITISQAVLGDTIKAETVHGTEDLKIPNGTEHGAIFKIKRKGVPHVHASGVGDHMVHIQIAIPSRPSRKERKLFEELRALED